jgi:hypothetical protein
MMGKFAEGTEVPVEKSRAEIEKILIRYGADQFMSGWREGAAMIAFRAKGRHLKFFLPLAAVTDEEFRRDGRGSVRGPQQRQAAWEQSCRERWRALCLCIKAKLEAVETGISTFESEFMANIVLPNGQTMGEHAAPLIAKAYETGDMPLLLPHLQ